MQLTIVTPAARGMRNGNRVTALRWAKRLRELGVRVRVTTEWTDDGADVLVALHATRSARAIRACLERSPRTKLVVGLSGTDVYGDLAGDPIALEAMQHSSAIVALQPLACSRLPVTLQPKCRVIQQSAPD